MDGAAAFRITRLVTTDKITAPLRDLLIRRYGLDSQIVRLTECDWCVSVHVALLLWLVPRRLRRVLAVAALVGVTATYT